MTLKVIFHDAFYEVYTSDPAAEAGRMEAVVNAIKPHVTFIQAEPAEEEDVAAVHTEAHIRHVKHSGLYPISALAAGAAVQTASLALGEPAFGLIRPPGHHASSGSSWGFCYFNNMAVAIDRLQRKGKIKHAYVLDIDLHFGDGTVNILQDREQTVVYNVRAGTGDHYLEEVHEQMKRCRADMIGISAGFDNHEEDWGGTLKTEDYKEIGRMVSDAARRCGGRCFGILEGGYNHKVLGRNVLALIQGLSGKQF